MIHHRERGAGAGGRPRLLTGQRQLAVVAGYSWEPNSLRVQLYLACGTLPSGRLRYSGRTALDLGTTAAKREFAARVRPLRAGAHHQGIASPLPPHIVPLAPRLLADVAHEGWSPAGLMRHPRLCALRDDEGPAAV